MTSITWNAEGGSDGTAISTANSGGASGTAWDVCQRGTNATNEFDSAQKANGSYSALIATGATSTTAYNRWTTAITNLWASGLTTHYGRLYIRTSALPGTNRVFAEWTDAGVTATRATLMLLTTGAIRLRNSSNGTVVTTTATLSVDTWYRIEYRIDGSTTGAYEIHLYALNSTTSIEDIVGGTANFGGAIGAVQYGYVSNGSSLASIWYDGLQVNDTGLPGPESSGTTVAVGQASETDTAGAVARLKTLAIAQATEADTAGAVSRLKTLATGQATETDTANPVGRLKTATVGLATETDTAQPLGRVKIAAVGQAVETDTATALARLKTVTLGQATETDTVTALGRLKVKAIGQAAETDTALAVTRAAPARDLDLSAGRPQVDWRASLPRINWAAGPPLVDWRAGTPTT